MTARASTVDGGAGLGPLTPLARGLRDAERLVTSRWRRLPDFLVIGAQKSGTTSLYDYLAAHPAIVPAMGKGVHYFEEHYTRGLGWYRSRFPFRTGAKLSGEATPAYLFYPTVPERVARDLPTVKLIAVLRNPADRAYSHYQHERASGVEELPLAAALSAEGDRLRGEEARVRKDVTYVSFPLLHYSYRTRGLYAEQIERWLRVVPRERLLILQAERLFADPAIVMNEVTSFLGLNSFAFGHYTVQNARHYEPMDPIVREELCRSFEEPNERLNELVGTRFDWE
jgi:hypothetical protein